MAKQQNMKTLSDTELSKIIANTRKNLREHRFVAAGSRPKDTNALVKARKTIARALTEQSARNASPAGSASSDSRPTI